MLQTVPTADIFFFFPVSSLSCFLCVSFSSLTGRVFYLCTLHNVLGMNLKGQV